MVHGLATNLAFWYFRYAGVFAKTFRVTLFDSAWARPLGDAGSAAMPPELLAQRLWPRSLDHLAHRTRPFAGAQLRRRRRDELRFSGSRAGAQPRAGRQPHRGR